MGRRTVTKKKAFIIAANIIAYIALFTICVFVYPDKGGAIVPAPAAAFLPVIAADYFFWLATRPEKPVRDYDSMNFRDLYQTVTRLRGLMESADKTLRKIADIDAHGWDPDRLREIVSGDWANIRDKEESAYLFDGDRDQQNWIDHFTAIYEDLLPDILDETENIVSWHLQNNYKTKFFTVGERGGGRARRVISCYKWEAYQVKCDACGREIGTEPFRQGDRAQRWGVRYGDEEFYFCSPRCRNHWMNDADGGRDFTGIMESWEEWADWKGGGEYASEDLRVVRIAYLHFR